MALQISRKLGIHLDFLSYPQESEQGKAMREWIVHNVDMLKREQMLKGMRQNDYSE
jgi:hypothetical protein